MAGSFQVSYSPGVPNVAQSMPPVQNFQSGETPIFELPYVISGVTRDFSGATLGACLIHLYRTADDSLVSQTTSDASGIYVIPASSLLNHYIVAYKPGSPDVAGTTVNTLVGA